LLADVESEMRYYDALTPPATGRFGGLPGTSEKLGLEKTGYFTTAKREGRWMLVDPDGNAFILLGVGGFQPGAYTRLREGESVFEWLPPHDGAFQTAWHPSPAHNATAFSLHLANMVRKYREPITPDRFAERMVPRVRKWGFSAARVSAVVSNGTMAAVSFPYVLDLSTAPEWRELRELPRLPNSFDPFDETTLAALDALCAKRLPSLAADPWLVGYSFGNEMTAGWGIEVAAPKLKRTPLKKRLVEFLEDGYGEIGEFNAAWEQKAADFPSLNDRELSANTPAAKADMAAFTSIYYDAFARAIAHAVRRYDARHLLISTAYRWRPDIVIHPELFRPEFCEIAGKYFDVIAVDHAGLGVDTRLLSQLSAWCGDKPLILTDCLWTSSSDSGLAGFNNVSRQEERGLAYRNLLEQALATGAVVGIEWLSLVDQPATNGTRNAEGFNAGLISVADRPWRAMLEHVTKANYEAQAVLQGARPPFALDDARFRPRDYTAKRQVSVPRMVRPVTIDGRDDDWDERAAEKVGATHVVQKNCLECHDRHRIGVQDYLAEDLEQQPWAADQAAQFRLAWDDANLYLVATVTDTTPLLNSNSGRDLEKGDCLELFVGHEDMSRSEGLLPGDRRVLLGAGVTNGIARSWVDRAKTQVECHVAALPAADGKGYVLEAAVPFAALGFQPQAGQRILFDFALDNSANGKWQRRQLMWNGSWRNPRDRCQWGRADFE
jgi:hypothetical protein